MDVSRHRNIAVCQRGMALIALVFLLSLAAATYVVHAMNDPALQVERTRKTMDALAQAKAALIGWSVNHPDLPGMMPFPDRNGDGNYDGNSDCYSGSFSYSFLLGQLPWAGQTNPCVTPQTGLGIDVRDGAGERLWYAVSRNLVRDYQTSTNPVINPGIIDNPPYPWMVVLDKKGNVVSDRVAAVIIAPGPPLEDQNRTGGIAGPAEYLDSFRMGAVTYSNRTYAMADEDFVMGESSDAVRNDDPSYDHPYLFNDRLVYITIDELLDAVQRRAAGEIGKALRNYRETQGFFPYAASLNASTSYGCVANNLEGKLPTQAGTPVGCTCTVGGFFSCSCGATNLFSVVGSVSYTRSGTNTWSATNVSGACARTPNSQTCTCTGAGYCKNTSGTRFFQCDAAGLCMTNAGGSYQFNDTFAVSSVTGGCTTTCGQVKCTSTGTFASTSCSDPALSLPAWIVDNRWLDYFVYRLTRATPTLTVGSRSGVEAVLVAAGKPITSAPYAISKGSAQSRPSCTLNDFLDSEENTDADLVFDAPNSPTTSQYNDQMFVVSP